MCGFIAQLVEQRTGNAEVTGSNPVEALIFFFVFSGFFFPIAKIGKFTAMIILLFRLQPQFKNELFSYTSHYGPTQPLSDFDVLSVQRQALQTVTRYSYGLFSFCCCSRNCHAKHRGTSPSYLNANCTSLVTLRWRLIHRRTQRRNRLFSRTP